MYHGAEKQAEKIALARQQGRTSWLGGILEEQMVEG
jgi:hypothetical protein